MSRSLYTRLGRRFDPDRFQPSRRDMLKAALGVGAALLLPGCATTPRPTAPARRVVVVGAGFSGLACADALLQAGYDVTVLESRPRVGGRVLSFSDLVPGRNVEGGGELIGSNHPSWMLLSQRFGLKMLDVSEYEDLTSPVILAGQRLDNASAKALFEEMDHAFTSMTADAAAVPEDEPWNTPNAAKLDARPTRAWIATLAISPLTKLAIEAELSANNGTPTDRQSYLGNLSQIKGGGLEKYWSDSEVYRCQGGNDQLATHLAKAVGEARLHLSTPVTKIQMTDTEAVVFAGSERFTCDHVVLALPPTVWDRISITPTLPRDLRPQIGENVKYLAAVSRRFWLDTKSSPTSLTDGDVSMTWDATDAQPDGPACLTSFSGGPAAKACRALTPAARDRAYASNLNALYPAFSTNFQQARFMDWPSEPWTRGGYSFPAPGQITTMGPVLKKGIGRLHFAGEHCCYKFVGYMEGALSSGADAARAIMQADSPKTRRGSTPQPSEPLAVG